MELWQKVVLAIVVVGTTIGIVLVAGYLGGWFGEPYVASIENHWGNVTENEMELITSVNVENPNLFNVKISSLQYSILLNNITVAEGRDTGITLKQGTTVVDYVSQVNMSRIPDWWSSHISHGERTHIEFEYTVKATAGPIHQTKTIKESYHTVDTDLLSALALNQPRNITVPIEGKDYGLLIATDFNTHWGGITHNTTILNATIYLFNPHDSDIIVDTFVYYFTMNEILVGNGHLRNSITIPPYATIPVACDTTINNNNLIDWFRAHIQNNETTHYEIGSSATFTHQGQLHTVEPIHLTGTVTTDMLE